MDNHRVVLWLGSMSLNGSLFLQRERTSRGHLPAPIKHVVFDVRSSFRHKGARGDGVDGACI